MTHKVVVELPEELVDLVGGENEISILMLQRRVDSHASLAPKTITALARVGCATLSDWTNTAPCGVVDKHQSVPTSKIRFKTVHFSPEIRFTLVHSPRLLFGE